jgi:ATP-dependent exoDNAse (exonuclease V) beta subunit
VTAITWSEAALHLFQLDAPTAVSAGAGSGKTTCLVELVLRLLSGEATGAPCEPAELAAITFTEKAAAELVERLRAALEARAAAAGTSEDARAWRRRLHALERMPVGTIHGFAGRLLREHAVEAGLDPELEVADEDTAQGWRQAAARAAVVAALDAGRPAARELAAALGAGGRREGLADVVADLVRERATLGDAAPPAPAPDRAGEARRAWDAVGAGARAVRALRAEVRTATGARAQEALAAALAARPDDPRAPGALAHVAALAAAVRGWRVGASDGPSARAAREALLAACEAFGPLAAEALAGPQKRELCALVADAEARYGAAKAAARALDFDDLLARARDLLRGDPALLAELRGRLRALLVDEYQDVNPLQQELFELLAGGDGGPLLVAVGDLKQSIYRFRGADVAVFHGVLARLGAGAGRVLHLTENHRSRPALLELVNEVFARCMQPSGPAARPYELAFGDADRLVPRRPAAEGPACEILEDAEEGTAAERRAREAAAVAARIRAYASGAAGVAVPEGGTDGERLRRPRHGDVAILLRRLTEVGAYAAALAEAGIPYRLARGGGFYQAPEVRDLGELLTSLWRPDDAGAWAALLRSPMCAISDGALFAVSRLGLATLARRAPEEVVAALVAAHPDAARPWPEIGGVPASTEASRLLRFLRTWHALHPLAPRLGPADLLRRAADALDLEAAHLASPGGERRLANHRKALALAERFGRRGGTARALAERLRAQAARRSREPEAELPAEDAVALLSVHQAKGLEWSIVFVPDLGASAPHDGRRALRHPSGALAAAFLDVESGGFVATAALAEAREEARRAGDAESRRLLYVALTRARERLVLSGEAGRAAGSWRALVEAGLAGRPDLALRIPLGEAGTRAVGAAIPGDAAAPPAPEPLPALAALRLPSPAPRVAVTALSEHARCPRRAHLRGLGLAERAGASGAVLDDPDRATARGTLAHAMLAEVDWAAPPLARRALVEAAALRRGYDPAALGVKRILVDVLRFLGSPGGERLARAARAGALRREVPFLLRLDAEGLPSCYVTGAIDALVEGRREVAVVDFKYAVARPGAAERYRLQLLSYALAAARAYPGRRVTAGLQFLRGGCASVDVTPSPQELRRFEREAPRLAIEASRGGADAAPPTPAELGRDEPRCRAEGCGFVWKCYPPAAGARGAAAA